MRKLKHADKLLSDIVDGVKKLDGKTTKIATIEVVFKRCFKQGPHVVVKTMDLVGALDVISNDLYFDEDGDFSDADSAEVRVM